MDDISADEIAWVEYCYENDLDLCGNCCSCCGCDGRCDDDCEDEDGVNSERIRS